MYFVVAIKTGRYTHEKRTRDIKEVKRLQHVEKLRQEGVDPSSLPAPCHPVPRVPPRESSNERKKVSKAVAQQQRADAIGSLTSSGLSVAELEAMVEHITEVHRQHTPHTAEFFAMLPQKEKEFLVRLPLPPSPSDLYPTLTSASFSF